MRLRSLILLWAAAAHLGCAAAAPTEGGPVAQGPVTLAVESPIEKPADALDPTLARLLDEMRRAYEFGDEDRARAAARAAQESEELPDEVEEYLDAFTRILDGKSLQKSMERTARVEPARDEVTLGDLVEFRLVLENPGIADYEETITIPQAVGSRIFSSSARAKTQIFATVTTIDLDAYGAESVRTETLPIRVREDIEIAPGGSYEMAFRLEGLSPQGAVARRILVGAEVVPSELRYGDRAVVLTRLRCQQGETLALPSGFESLASQPLEALRAALKRTEPAFDRSVLPAALMVPAEERADARKALARALISATSDGGSLSRARAIVAALRQLTGDEQKGLDLGAWIGWASAQR
ncbi:MAG: hypothetical protein JNJ88_21330 [Planctomycetes bacterium]|nr:hypothetical protein [Planctomycetota bacterium]